MENMPNWYPVQVVTRMETKVEERLRRIDYETYLPMALVDKRLRKTKDSVIEPLLPGYLFVRACEGTDEFRPIANTQGVLGFIRQRSKKDGSIYPSHISETLINMMKQHENDEGIHDIKHDYQPGDAIRISTGLFEGAEAIFHEPTKQGRLRAFVKFMGKNQLVMLDYQDVESVT